MVRKNVPPFVPLQQKVESAPPPPRKPPPKQQAPAAVKEPRGKIEVLIGGPYKGHGYGHAALRVITQDGERIYDYGRYGATWGTFKSEGEGVLNVWTSFAAYMAGEKATGRTTYGFTYDVPEAAALSVNRHFDSLVGSKTPRETRGDMKRYVLDASYHALTSNCTTVTLNGAQVALGSIAAKAAEFNKGLGMGFAEKAAAHAKGWPSGIFMPLDLKAMLDSGTDPPPIATAVY
jgi:hypothetical protein